MGWTVARIQTLIGLPISTVYAGPIMVSLYTRIPVPVQLIMDSNNAGPNIMTMIGVLLVCGREVGMVGDILVDLGHVR